MLKRTSSTDESFSSLPIPILLEVISQLDISDFANLFRLDCSSQTRFRFLFENYIVAHQQRVFEWAINLSKNQNDNKLLLHILEKSVAFRHFYIDPSALNNKAMRWASENGHDRVVALLLQDPRVNPSAEDNYAIRKASRENQEKVVALLLKDPRVDPNADDNYAMQMAVAGNCYEVVTLLLQDPRVDPNADNNHAIKSAMGLGLDKMANLLLQDPRVRSNWYKVLNLEIN